MFVLDDDVITKETNNVFWKNSKIRANYNIISSANDNVPSKPTNKKQYTININNRKNKFNSYRKNKTDNNFKNKSDNNFKTKSNSNFKKKPR